jgi:hypothetical protein
MHFPGPVGTGTSGEFHCQYRPLREVLATKGPHIVPLGNNEASSAATARCISSCLGRVREVMRTPEIRTGNSWAGRQQNIVPPGKPYRPPWEVFGLDLIVLPGKNCRPRWEILASSPGSNIVLHRNIYRPLAENISSHQGKIIVLSGKACEVFPANSRVSLCAMMLRPVFVCVKCLLCVYSQKGYKRQ